MEWLRLVRDYRAMLDTESGSNLFDFDGSIAAKLREMTEADCGTLLSYAKFYRVVAEWDA